LDRRGRDVNQVLADTRHCRFLIGLDLEEFGELFSECLPALKKAFPRARDVTAKTEKRLSLRMKLFIALMVLRKGYAVRDLAALIGWSKSVIADTCRKCNAACSESLDSYLQFPSAERQLKTCESFRAALGRQQGESGPVRTGFAAADCTYYMLPKPQDEWWQELYYTGYRKFHGLKLSLIVCILSGRILHVAFSPASSADNSVYEALQEEELVALGATLFRDKAYEGIDSVVSPFKEDFMNDLRLNVGLGIEGAAEAYRAAEDFNTWLGKYRIRVEQAIGGMKQWSAARGSSRKRMVVDLGVVQNDVKLVCKLVNFVQHIRQRNVPVLGGRKLRDDDWFLPVFNKRQRRLFN
jgi:hypothetical protein